MNRSTVGILLLLAGCTSTTLSTAQRISDIQACAIAAAAAGIPIVQAVADASSPNTKKATDAQTAVHNANALPACLKVGANAAVVVSEHMKHGSVPVTAPK